MGKKSKHKKQRNQQRQQTIAATSTPTIPSAPAVQMSRATGLELGEQFTRRDIIRIVILLGVVALALIALVIADTQSSFVLDVGRKLASILRLS
jgi:hypothetical protein